MNQIPPRSGWSLLLVTALLPCSICLSLCSATSADVRLAGFFGDHMVLQQGMPIRIWGWADPSESVEVTLGDSSVKTTAEVNGKWQVELPSMTAGKQAYSLLVKAGNTLELTDVLIGEVWLCSGQSNMEWSVRQCANAEAEIAAGNHPFIRHLKIARRPSPVPIDDIQADWQVCSEETVARFSATAYYTAVQLQKELDVPIGVINSSWGGTRIEPWTAPEGFKSVEALDELYQSTMTRTPGTRQYQELLADHIEAMEDWLAKVRPAAKSTDILSPSPDYPSTLKPLVGHQDPTALYNGMIHGMVGLPIRGVLWYQGESNRADGMMYYEKMKALIQGWREIWGQGDFPFYYVQIGPFQYGNDDPEVLPRLWEAQAAALELPHTGMVVINDIATINNIHPPNKQDVGARLAGLAMKNDYGRADLVANGPQFDSVEAVPAGSITVFFKNTAGGLKTRDGKAPTHFEIAGPNSDGFQSAQATVDGDSVILQSNKVAAPSAFRFAWHKTAEPNLTGGSGLPAGAVRGGKVPTLLDSVPDGDQYTLVYDLDLARLNEDIRYDVDHSKQIRDFDRIGYLLELDNDSREAQSVFVSMEAFTNDVTKIGIPTVASTASFQQTVESMTVASDVDGLITGTGIETGHRTRTGLNGSMFGEGCVLVFRPLRRGSVGILPDDVLVEPGGYLTRL